MTAEQQKIFAVASSLAIALLVVATFLIGYKAGKGEETGKEVIVKTEIETRIDTVKIEKPVFVDRYVRDSIKVVIKDTIRVHDTTYMYLPREYKVYQDSSYRAVVSGIDPMLDSIETYNATRVITIETMKPSKPRSRWGIGIQAGYGATRYGMSPIIGVGVSYTIFEFESALFQ